MSRFPRAFPVLVAVSILAAAARVPAVRAAPDARLLGRIAIKEPGFIHVSGPALARLGAGSAAQVTVTHRGRTVPTQLADQGAGVVFLAQGHATDHSAWGTYELRAGEAERPDSGLRAARVPSEATRRAPSARRIHAPDHVHGAVAAALDEVYDKPDVPTWFLAFAPHRQGASLDLEPMGAAPGTDQTLEVRAFATHRGPVALHAAWGDADLGVTRRETAAGGATFAWSIPSTSVPNEGSALVLRDVSPALPAAPAHDASRGRGALWIDAVALSGPVEALVDARLRVFDVLPDAILELEIRRVESAPRVNGGPWLALVGPDGAPLALPPLRIVEGRGEPNALVVDLQGVPEGARLFASVAARDAEVRAVEGTRPDPLGRARGAEHVILAVPALEAAAQRLAAHRRTQGISSVVIPVTDVYDVFGHGEHTPQAIRAFLVARMRQSDVPLEYILLAGDAVLDRTDMTPFTTIPGPMARTMYNGATPADRLYALPPDESDIGGPSIGRLPFRDAAAMEAYVERVIRYETSPPVDASRRLFRFVTNEGRFGALIDSLLEGMFRSVIAKHVPAAYDIEVTYASTASPYLWPPADFNAKVIGGFNEGCLFYTYVGHGFGRGFDSLRAGKAVFPVLHVDHVGRVACRGTPPVVLVLACTTAIFDQPRWEGIGEALLARPEGPVAYWGATRICHPVANAFLGKAIAEHMAHGEGRWRLGEILDRSRDHVLRTLRLPDGEKDLGQRMLEGGIRMLVHGADPARLALEGTWMYSLLGDPALKVAFPRSDLVVEAKVNDARVIEARVMGDLPKGSELHLSLEVPRSARLHTPDPVSDPLDPEAAEQIRANHRIANDLAIARAMTVTTGDETIWKVELDGEVDARELVVKAWTITGGNVRQGATALAVPPPPENPRTD